MTESPAPQPLPVEGQRPQWDVTCEFCGVVSAAWNRPEIATEEMRDHIAMHIAMHMKGVKLVRHQEAKPSGSRVITATVIQDAAPSTPSVESEGPRYASVDELPCYDGLLDNAVVVDEEGFAVELLAWANEIANPTTTWESEGEAK